MSRLTSNPRFPSRLEEMLLHLMHYTQLLVMKHLRISKRIASFFLPRLFSHWSFIECSNGATAQAKEWVTQTSWRDNQESGYRCSIRSYQPAINIVIVWYCGEFEVEHKYWVQLTKKRWRSSRRLISECLSSLNEARKFPGKLSWICNASNSLSVGIFVREI